MRQKIMTNREARAYIQSCVGKPGLPYHRSQMQRWRRYGWLIPHTVGENGRQNTYTIEALDALVAKLRINYRRKRNN